jgi:succinoglycan biosynthesis transport protein ExoP
MEALQDAIHIVRRQLPIILVIILCSLAAAMFYLAYTPPRFTATAAMVVDTHKIQVLDKESVLGDAQIDTATVQTQVQLLNSDNIALAVIRNLHLIDDPEFVPPSGGKPEGLFSFLSPAEPAKALTDEEREHIALGNFRDGLSVSREGLTYVINAAFTSLNAQKSALIANAVAEAFVENQLSAKYQLAKRASAWLLERTTELRAQAAAAERAVVDFRKENNLIDIGSIPVPGPAAKSLDDQQLSELNNQLTLATAASVEAKARLNRVNAVISEDLPDASVADALRSEVIIKLRSEYLTLAQREALYAQKYGVNHQATINLRMQMQEVRHSIADQMKKIAESYKSDYEIARTREQSLRATLATAVTQTQTSNQARLRELTSNAETTRALYDHFLQRYMETVQQQDALPIGETRLASPAIPPMFKSSPKVTLTLFFALASAGLLSFAVAYLREASDRVFRTRDQVENTLRVICLALIPALKTARLEKEAGGAGGSPAEGKKTKPVALLQYVLEAPLSRYAEAIRSVKIAADLKGAHKVIGLTSTWPNEGKSTLAGNLAHLIADAGSRALLLDADLRNPSLSQWLAPKAPGLVDAVIGNAPIDNLVVTLPSSRLDFLPAGATSKLPHTNEILASAAMKRLVNGLRAKYDYIIVDLSPVMPIVDVRITGHLIDTYICVIEWGKTKIDAVEHGLSQALDIYDRLLGVVLNKVDVEAQTRYERYDSNSNCKRYYQQHGYLE